MGCAPTTERPGRDRSSHPLARRKKYILLNAGGGLRRGEVLGLRWGAIDLDTGRLTIRRRVNRVGRDLGGLIDRRGPSVMRVCERPMSRPLSRTLYAACVRGFARSACLVASPGSVRTTRRGLIAMCLSPNAARSG